MASMSFKTTVDTRDLRDDLESVQIGLGREVGRILREASAGVVPAARVLTPFDPAHRTDRRDGLPHIRDTIAQGGTSALQTTVVSTHPAAAVFEWNDGTRPAIAPRGVPITIPAAQMAHRAAEQQLPAIERKVADGLDRLIRDAGL